jgi:hypothetical protein
LYPAEPPISSESRSRFAGPKPNPLSLPGLRLQRRRHPLHCHHFLCRHCSSCFRGRGCRHFCRRHRCSRAVAICHASLQRSLLRNPVGREIYRQVPDPCKLDMSRSQHQRLGPGCWDPLKQTETAVLQAKASIHFEALDRCVVPSSRPSPH